MKNYTSLMTEHIVVYTYIINKEKERKEMNKYKHYSCSIENPLKRSIQSSAINLWSRFQRGTILSPFSPLPVVLNKYTPFPSFQFLDFQPPLCVMQWDRSKNRKEFIFPLLLRMRVHELFIMKSLKRIKCIIERQIWIWY